MYKKLKERIHAIEPELILVSYSNTHEAHFQLLDCDGYAVGKLICVGVRMMCLSSQGESYDKVDEFFCHELPADFFWLSKEEMEGKTLFVFRPLKEYVDMSLLPIINGERVGYIVCESITYEVDQS
jgi:hypothetical protein